MRKAEDWKFANYWNLCQKLCFWAQLMIGQKQLYCWAFIWSIFYCWLSEFSLCLLLTTHLLLFHLACPFSAVATANHHFPFQPVLFIFYSDYLHVLAHRIYKSPLCLLPGSFIPSALLPINPLFLLCTHPNHLNLVSSFLFKPFCLRGPSN